MTWPPPAEPTAAPSMTKVPLAAVELSKKVTSPANKEARLAALTVKVPFPALELPLKPTSPPPPFWLSAPLIMKVRTRARRINKTYATDLPKASNPLPPVRVRQSFPNRCIVCQIKFTKVTGENEVLVDSRIIRDPGAADR